MAAGFTILFSEVVKEDLQAVRQYDRQTVLDAIEVQLRHAPHVETRRRKLLRNLIPPFEAVPPILQLRIGGGARLLLRG